MMSSINEKHLTAIEGLIRGIGGGMNRLVKEVSIREKATASASPSDVTNAPWHDFEKMATDKLGSSDLGWKQDFERQTGLREGVLKGWNQRGYVPAPYIGLCAMLSPTKPVAKAKRVSVQQDEKDAVAALYSAGMSVQDMRESMNNRFGDRRDYLANGPILGILQRLHLKVADR